MEKREVVIQHVKKRPKGGWQAIWVRGLEAVPYIFIYEH